MAKQATVVNLDPIDRKKKLGFIGRLFITSYHGGDKVIRSEKFGHYMFCGPQRSGKTATMTWFAERLRKRYKKRKLKYFDNEQNKFVKFDEPPKVRLWTNFLDVGTRFEKSEIFDLIDKLDPYANEVRIFMIDEFHTYFPKGSTSKDDKETLANLTAVFSQLAKRNVYVLSSAQVYGRLDKALREQCLYMIDNRVKFNGKIESSFILETDIICDELGRWAGTPKRIYVHGLAKTNYDTKKLIRK